PKLQPAPDRRSVYSYLLRLHRQGLLERKQTRRGTLAYRLTERGRARLNHPPAPGTEEHELLQAYLQAKYRIVVPQSRVQGAGAYFVDLLSAEELFIMDIGLSQTPLDVAYATRTIPLGQFWMTGGAGLPTG